MTEHALDFRRTSGISWTDAVEIGQTLGLEVPSYNEGDASRILRSSEQLSIWRFHFESNHHGAIFQLVGAGEFKYVGGSTNYEHFVKTHTNRKANWLAS